MTSPGLSPLASITVNACSTYPRAFTLSSVLLRERRMVHVARSHRENFSTDKQLRSRLACKRAYGDRMRADLGIIEITLLQGRQRGLKELSMSDLIKRGTRLPSTGQSFSVHCNTLGISAVNTHAIGHKPVYPRWLQMSSRPKHQTE